MSRRLLIVVALVALCATVRADPDVQLRMATVAPEGSLWGRELKNFSTRVEQATGGHLRVKWYLNAIAGDELEELERTRRGQVDGGGLAAACERIAPPLRVVRLPALFQDREEAREVASRLQPMFAAEAHRAGKVITGVGLLGADTIFTRVPVHSMAELRKLRMWRWDTDEVAIAGARAMGLQIVPLPIWDAARAYDEGRIDGFFVIPSAALVWQFSTRARYLTDLKSGYVSGCLFFTERSFNALPVEYQSILREASAVFRERTDELERQADDALVGGLFKKQGVILVPPSESFRAEFFAASRTARDQIATRFVDKQLLERVTQMLADYRAEHSNRIAP